MQMKTLKSVLALVLAAMSAGACLAEQSIEKETVGTDSVETGSRLRALVITHPDPRMEGNIYKFPLDKIGATYEVITTDQVGDNISRLNEFDIIMLGLLANASGSMTSYVKEIGDWVRQGGAVGIFDGCDGSVYCDFVKALCTEDETNESKVWPRGCYGWENTTRYGYVLETNPMHPLRCFPRKVRFECRQWHCLGLTSDWTPVATCSGPAEKHPVTAVKRMGRGYVYISSMQQRWSTVAENLRAFLMCCQIGLEPIAYTAPQIRPGKEELTLRCKAFDGVDSVSAVLTVTDANGGEKNVKKEFKPDAEKPGEIAVSLLVPFKARGDVRVKLVLKTSLGERTIIDEAYTVPEAAIVHGPRYRNRLSVSRRTESVLIKAEAYPDGGRAKGDSVSIKIMNPMNMSIAKATAKFPDDLAENVVYVPVELPLSTRLEASSNYKVVATVKSGDKEYKAECPFTVVGTEHPGEVTIDEDHTLIVDGKPFYPLVIYHIKPEFYTNAVQMGFNTVQAFQWHSRHFESFNLAKEMGMKVFFENNEKQPGGFEHMPAKYGGCESFLMWYLPDEPLHEVDTVFVNQVHEIVTRDVFHPTATVDFNAPRFAANAARADILAPDRYIIRKDVPPEQQPYGIIVDAMDAATLAVEGRKPVMLVEGAFGFETEVDFMITAFLAICRDARGLMWYTWDENNGKTGVRYNETCQAALANTVAAVHKIEPYLLDPVRRTFEVPAGKGKLYGIVCGTEKCAMAVVNPTADAVEMPKVPEMGKATVEDLIGSAPAEGGDLIEPFSVRVVTWSNSAKPKKKAKKAASGDDGEKSVKKSAKKSDKSAKTGKKTKKKAKKVSE